MALGLYLVKELAFDSIRMLVDGARPTFTSLFRFGWAPGELPLLAVATAFIVVEESVYRGYGLGPLVERLGTAGGLAVMGTLFGLLHWGNGGVHGAGRGGPGRRVPVAADADGGGCAHALYNAMVVLT